MSDLIQTLLNLGYYSTTFIKIENRFTYENKFNDEYEFWILKYKSYLNRILNQICKSNLNSGVLNSSNKLIKHEYSYLFIRLDALHMVSTLLGRRNSSSGLEVNSNQMPGYVISEHKLGAWLNEFY